MGRLLGFLYGIVVYLFFFDDAGRVVVAGFAFPSRAAPRFSIAARRSSTPSSPDSVFPAPSPEQDRVEHIQTSDFCGPRIRPIAAANRCHWSVSLVNCCLPWRVNL